MDVTHVARVGSLTFGGIPPILSIEDVVEGGGPGSFSWSGLTAQSVTDATYSASSVGSLFFSGVSPILIIEEVVEGSGPASLSWSGIRANSTTVAVGAALAHVGSLSWSGLRALSTASSGATGEPARHPGVACAVGSQGTVDVPPYAGTVRFSRGAATVSLES